MLEVNERAWSEVDNVSPSLREQYSTLPRMPIEILACPLGKEVNHGGLLRLAEAFRLEGVSLSREPDDATDFSGNQSATKWQPWQWQDIEEAIAARKGRQLVALTLTDDSMSFRNFEYRFPMSLVVGSEWDGIPEDVLNQCHGAVAIPMFGMMGSLNVVTATAIVIEHIANRYADQTGIEPIRPESKKLRKS